MHTPVSGRLAMVLLAALGATGCERELPFEARTNQAITGYRIEGYVTDRLGVPVKNVRVVLWYDFSPLANTTPPSRSLFVDDTNKTVLLRVLDSQKNVLRVLFSGKAPIGELDHVWNSTDSLGRKVPSGVYSIEFRLGDIVRNSYPVIVNGAISALTDSLGHYLIPNENLPVGFSPVPLYSTDGRRFLGNYQITPFIILEFNLDFPRRASLTLKKDEITRFDLRL